MKNILSIFTFIFIVVAPQARASSKAQSLYDSMSSKEEVEGVYSIGGIVMNGMKFIEREVNNTICRRFLAPTPDQDVYACLIAKTFGDKAQALFDSYSPGFQMIYKDSSNDRPDSIEEREFQGSGEGLTCRKVVWSSIEADEGYICYARVMD